MKKTLPFALMLVAGLTLAGCDKKEEPKAPPAEPSTEQPATPAPTTPPANEAAPAPTTPAPDTAPAPSNEEQKQQ
ncbi:hypothetical protein DK254_32550 [Pseudomonas sp. RW407]|uniref:hypothetical protein n=1 Tax=Pseudomonas sp. RW407 TaxID=2202894 RepID=UPI000D6F62A9|nr:hypothetical protein [Pseudomonas sp. RW407]PWU27230.1 hypothetical protein DK254_32550 [Pseudomonas sp. RW407]